MTVEKGYKSVKGQLLVVAALIFLAGCQGQLLNEDLPSRDLPASISIRLSEYLQDVPAVKSITPWPNSYADGITITTEHYTINTTLLEPLMLRQLAGFVESVYAACQDQLPYPVQTGSSFTFYLFADRLQWESFTADFAGPDAPLYLQIKKGAYYLNGACVAYNIGRTRTFSVIGHEAWHQFNNRHFAYRLPSWLDEGIASLFESSEYRNGRFQFDPAGNSAKLAALKGTIVGNKMIPLQELIILNPGQVVNEPSTAMAFYAQSYALVRFLREEDYGRRLRNYHNLLLAGLRGNWPIDEVLQKVAADRNITLTTQWLAIVSPKLFALYIDEDIKAVEDEYLGFCNKLVYRARVRK